MSPSRPLTRPPADLAVWLDSTLPKTIRELTWRCPVCGESYDADTGACIAGCYCPDLDDVEPEGDEQP